MKKKNWYYVLVFTNAGPVYVTNTAPGHVAYWDRLGKPAPFERYRAEDIAMGLRFNGTSACVVHYPYELDNQPYYYDRFEVKITKKEDENVDEK